MNRNELRKADINLMVVFETLMLERNVTRAAEKLFLGQPTISSALNRLRAMFNDPLFIRVGHRMEPTARAEELFRYLSPALDSRGRTPAIKRRAYACVNASFRASCADGAQSLRVRARWIVDRCARRVAV